MGWACNDGQYMDAAESRKLVQVLKADLATSEAAQAYADFYENKYRHRSSTTRANRPTGKRLAEFMARAYRWADFLTNCGGFEIR